MLSWMSKSEPYPGNVVARVLVRVLTLVVLVGLVCVMYSVLLLGPFSHELKSGLYCNVALVDAAK
jgi:hypothetical protein